MSVREFQKKIRAYYRAHGRKFAWRNTRDPYRILVSEVMLQQTQTGRVAEKYPEFLKAFPSLKALARANVSDVLRVWSGLGYNRRALYLQRAAREILKAHQGKVPASVEELSRLPGIGKNTASAVCAFAFGLPAVFIETNIRTVFLHHFFKHKESVPDADLLPLIARSLDVRNPREWYYALMDYGVMLKKNVPNPSRRSAHHVRQSSFKESNRYVRGLLLKTLLRHPRLSESRIRKELSLEPERISRGLAQLVEEGILIRSGRTYAVAS